MYLERMKQMRNLRTLLNSALIIFIVFISSCAKLKTKEKNQTNLDTSSSAYFDYKDITGTYQVKRELKIQGNKLFIRKTLFASNQSEYEPLEKTVSVSEVGNVRIKKSQYPVLRPFASQHTVWLDKKKHFVQTKVDKKTRKLVVIMDSPQEKWQGTRNIVFPQGIVFCYFSQVPECVARTGFLKAASKKKKGEMSLLIIWDNYPYHQEQFANMKDEVFSSAKFSFAENEKAGYKFALDTENHAIFYHFDKKLRFSKMYWIAQGISLVRK